MNSEIAPATKTFRRRFGSSRRSAHLARRLAVGQLNQWGIQEGSQLLDAAAQIIAELTANAVTHGNVLGREFELWLGFAESDGLRLRIEVSDARGERTPSLHSPHSDPGPYAESGRGLWLVAVLATKWGVASRPVGKTVWAELTAP